MNSRFDPLFAVWREHIPLVSAMQIQLVDDQNAWHLSAPLAPNRNHMGTGFGGALASIATLAGWAQTWLVLPDPTAVHIVVAHSEVRYLAPATSDITAHADTPDDSSTERFLIQMARRGRGRLTVTSRVFSNDVETTVLTGQFVATARNRG